MKLQFHGHDDRYAIEQSLLAFFPEERPVYEGEDGDSHAEVTLHEGNVYATGVTTLTYGGKTARGEARVRTAGVSDAYERERLRQRALKLSFFRAARDVTGVTPSWGALTGIRPAKLVRTMLEDGMTPAQADRVLRDTYCVSPARRRLALESAEAGLKARSDLRPEDISLYIGIPFCPTRCAYCSFVSASVEKSFKLMEPYLAALTAEGLAAFRAGGVNRLSLGVQSANADELRALGRLHSFPDAVRAVETARAVGIGNISLDFMIGIPGQTPDSLRRTLEAALALEPEHLSAYCLSLEPGTPFGRRGRAGLGLPADEDEAAEQASALYELSARLLSAAGYEHYEISNYARPGMRSRHNLHTWQDKPYIGLGVGAYSYLHGVRFGQSRDLSAFLDGRDITVDRYIPDRREQMEEYIMLGLRLAEGISEADFRTRFGVDFWATRGAVCEPLLRAGLARRPDGRFALTESGWLVSNAILADLV